MPYAAASSKSADLDAAVQSVCDVVRRGLGGKVPDLTFMFVSREHEAGFDDLARLVNDLLGSRVLLGCTAESIVSGHEEIESGPALCLWSAQLPGATLEPFHAEFAATADGLVTTGIPSSPPEGDGVARAAFVLGEPFSSAPKSIIDRFADDFPGVPLIGGMASGGQAEGENCLFLNSDRVLHGAVGVLVGGDVRIRTVVSQGCRPIGSPYVVTRAERNVVYELGGHPPMDRLSQIVPDLSERDRKLIRRGLHLGVAINAYRDSFGRGDFLISNVIGARPDDGVIAIGGPIRAGQTVQFHVRDEEAADVDLVELLDRDRADHAALPAAGLLFSCNGRGTRLFSQPHHDALAVQSHAGPIPLAGFFAQGEIGPVGGRNHLHSFTACLALFE